MSPCNSGDIFLCYLYPMSDILSQRPFNLEDGERYVLIFAQDGKESAFTRKYKDKAIISKTLKDAKTFHDPNQIEKILKLIRNKSEYEIYQVKDIFVPKYFIKFCEKRVISEPHIKSKTAWYHIHEDDTHTYTDYCEAKRSLDKYKAMLLDYYYRNIMDLKSITIDEMSKGTG